MKRVAVFAALFACAVAFAPHGAVAAGPDQAFFQSASGAWNGPGEIIAGKYKGTRFNCEFKGTTDDKVVGLQLDGGCRVGPFLQKMAGRVQKGAAGYSGSFLDGAEGKGLDVLSGQMAGPDKLVLTINRKQLNGIMQARLTERDTLTVTISVKVESEFIPVIGMNLKRIDQTEVGSIAK